MELPYSYLKKEPTVDEALSVGFGVAPALMVPVFDGFQILMKSFNLLFT